MAVSEGKRAGRALPARARRRLRWVGMVVAALGVLAGGYAAAVFVRAAVTLPPLGDPLVASPQASVIYDLADQPVATLPGGGTRTPVPITEIPVQLQHAFIAVEDRYFYQDHGISLRGILRAAYEDLRGRPLQGGSTITEQLAKNLYLNSRDTLYRKMQEVLLGLELAHRYSKAQILDMYLNDIYFGSGAYGVQAAAQTYFGVPAAQLTLPQEALLAGLPKAPSSLDPLLHPAAAQARRNLVLAVMAERGAITAAQAQAAEAAPLALSPGTPAQTASPDPYPWFVDAVVAQLEQQYGYSASQLESGGLQIHTTLDPPVYQAAQAAVTRQLNAKFPLSTDPADPMQAAVVMLNQSNGDVLAVIGGRQYTTPMGYDRATQAQQQPGSAIKPLVDYIPALLAGYTAGTTVNDVVHTYNLGGGGTYIPTNYDHLYYGLTTFTEALRRSVNTVAVQVLNRVGVARGVAVARAMGLSSLSQAANDHLSVALGGTVGCCSPLEMADAYATIANGGYRVTPRLITTVVGPTGHVLLSVPVQRHRVISAQVAYVMTTMLEAVDTPQPNTGWDVLSGPYDSNWGTGYDAQVQNNIPGWQMAAKTGTTNSDRQAWYVGYTPLYTGAVWLGQDIPHAQTNMFGGTDAGPILQASMQAALQGNTPVPFPQPKGIVTSPIDIMSPPWHVSRPGPLTPAADVRQEWFVAGTQPTSTSPLWVQLTVPKRNNGALWRIGCPGGPPVPDTFLDLGALPTLYGAAWAHGIARLLGTSDWQQFLPLDSALAAPTQHCAPSLGALSPFGAVG